MAPVFLTTMGSDLVLPSTALAAVRPKLVVRMGTDGLGLMRFTSPSMGLRRSVKTLSKAGQESDGFEEEVEIVIKLEQMREFLGTHIHPEELTNLKDGEAVVLSGLKEAAVRGYTIVKDVSYRMRPEPGSPLFDALFGIGLDFLGLMRLVIFPVGISIILVARLDTLRRVVSSACDTPLPRTLTTEPDESPRDDSLDEEIVHLVKTFCQIVEDDVMTMISTKY